MNKKVLNTLLTIIVILIVIIFSSIYYYVTKNKATNSIYDDIESIQELPLETNENIDNLEVVQPFTGAFPQVDIIPFLFEENDITTFSNEQILRLGFSKITKDDWADTYQGEGRPLSIPANLLDGYIKEILGEDINYQKQNFSNSSYSIDKDVKSHTNSYDIVYEPKTDTYTINHIAGDGIGENYVELFKPSVSKIKDYIEVEIPYAFVVYAEEMASGTIDGQESQGFEYIIYANCDYKTKTFSEELGRFTEFDVNENGEFVFLDHIEEIKNKNLAKLQRLHLIYKVNEAGTNYVLKEIKK